MSVADTGSGRGTTRKPRRAGGFTLIELMVTVAIIAILASIAYPSYEAYIRDTRRTEAQAALSGLAAVMERWFSDNNTYAGIPLGPDAGDLYPDWAPTEGARDNRSYDLGWCTFGAEVDGGLDDPDNLAYCLQATPVAGSVVAENGALQLTSTGTRRWDRNNDGDVDAGESTWQKR
jgi:type IV pilus assembly protein PilE